MKHWLALVTAAAVSLALMMWQLYGPQSVPAIAAKANRMPGGVAETKTRVHRVGLA